MKCEECKHVAYTQDGGIECDIGDCPIKIRNKALEEAAEVVEGTAFQSNPLKGRENGYYKKGCNDTI